jgi:L-lactate permease
VGLLKGVLVFALELLVPLLIVWAMARWRKPLWIRWAVGATAYFAYLGLAESWPNATKSWLIVGSFAGMLAIFAATTVFQLRHGSSVSVEEFRPTANSIAETLARIGPIKLAWIEFALLPALVVAVVYYTRRFVVARRALAASVIPPRHDREGAHLDRMSASPSPG